MQIALGMEGNTQRPRRWELEEAGQVLDSGMTRQTSKHRSAKVWLAHQFSDAAIPVKETKTQRYERVLRTIRDVCECCEGLETIAVDRIRGLCEEAL